MPVLGVALAVFVVVGLISCDSRGDGDVVSPSPPQVAADWVEAVYEVAQRDRLSAPVVARLYAYTGVALYESLALGEPTSDSAGLRLPGLPSFDDERGRTFDATAVATSAHARVLLTVGPSLSPESVAQVRAVEQGHLNAQRAGGVTESVMARSAEVGQRIADAVVAWAAEDGFTQTRGRIYNLPHTNPETWQPTPPLQMGALQPYWGTLRTVLVTTEDRAACPLAPPPAVSADPDSPFGRDVREVYDVSRALTAERMGIALHWEDAQGRTGTPAGHWMMIARQMMLERHMSPLQAARLYAVMGVVMHDAFVVTWGLKYHYLYPRPVTAIQAALQPTWVPAVVTPPFPEYPSGHSVVSPAAAVVLTDLVGGGGFTDATAASRRSFASFREAAEEASISRLYGGIHFRPAIENGHALGACLGAAMLRTLRAHAPQARTARVSTRGTVVGVTSPGV